MSDINEEKTTMSASTPTEDTSPVYAETDDFADEQDGWEPDQEQPLARRPRRRLLTPVTALLFALLLGAGGFIIGVEVEKNETSSSTSTRGAGRFAALLGATSAGGASAVGTGGGGAGASAAGGAAGAGGGEAAGRSFGGRGFAGAGGPAGAGGAGTTAGQVAYISGSDLYVTDLQGNTVKVSASGAQITRQVKSTVKGVHPGDTVIVQGATNANGSIVASTVRDSGSSGGGLGGALFGGSSSTGAGRSSSTGTSGGGGGGGGAPGGGEPALFGK